jgi:hypothetical protein
VAKDLLVAERLRDPHDWIPERLEFARGRSRISA